MCPLNHAIITDYFEKLPEISGYEPKETARSLRNIQNNREFSCYLLDLTKIAVEKKNKTNSTQIANGIGATAVEIVPHIKTVLKLDNSKFALRASNGKIVCADGNLTSNKYSVMANRDVVNEWEIFEWDTAPSGKRVLRAYNKMYWRLPSLENEELVATGPTSIDGEGFLLIDLGNDKIALRTTKGRYVGLHTCSDNLVAGWDAIEANSSFQLINGLNIDKLLF